MNNLPIISSLRIKKLFGEHDLSIDFKKLTVLVGKNGLGKTTLLKIVYGLIKGTDQIDYQSICESIELEFSDGNVICYGTVSEKIINSATQNEVTDMVLRNSDFIKKINSVFDEIGDIPDNLKKNLAKDFVKEFMKSDKFQSIATNFFLKNLGEDKNTILVNKAHRDLINGNVHLRYISTVNISANAGNKLDFGNSVEKNLLDLAIYEELRILLKDGTKSESDSFITQLNSFLQESGKKVKREHGEWFFLTGTGQSLRLDQLSSGERQLVYILATTANTCGKPTLFLMDEPEVSLHLSWQEKILDAIMNINPLMQIIAVTHSPGIIMNGHMDAYIEMKDIMQVSKNG